MHRTLRRNDVGPAFKVPEILIRAETRHRKHEGRTLYSPGLGLGTLPGAGVGFTGAGVGLTGAGVGLTGPGVGFAGAGVGLAVGLAVTGAGLVGAGVGLAAGDPG